MLLEFFLIKKKNDKKKSYFQIFNDKSVAENLGIDLNLRPQNIDKETFISIAKKYDELSR